MLGETAFSGSDSMMRPTHYVSPHWVNSYVRRDGTVVSGYWRDGDGNTFVDRGFGYFARNPLGKKTAARRSGKGTITADGLTFKVGPSALETGLSDLLSGALIAGLIAIQVDGIGKNIKQAKRERGSKEPLI